MRQAEIEPQAVIERYRKGVALYAIAKDVGTTHHTIKRLLAAHGEPLRAKRDAHRASHKYKCKPTGEVYNGKDVYENLSSGRLFVFKDYKWGRANTTIKRAICSVCGLSFLCGDNDAVRRVCSDACRSKMQSADGSHNWSGGRKYKRGNKGGHVLVYAPNHPHAKKNFCFEHRLVVEKQLGRYLTDDEVIHHINGVMDDNRVENLCVCTKSEHSIAHNSVVPLLRGLLDDGIIVFNRDKKIYERG